MFAHCIQVVRDAEQHSLALRRELGDRHGEGQTLANLALLRQAQGDKIAALGLAREALQVFEATGMRQRRRRCGNS